MVSRRRTFAPPRDGFDNVDTTVDDDNLALRIVPPPLKFGAAETRWDDNHRRRVLQHVRSTLVRVVVRGMMMGVDGDGGGGGNDDCPGKYEGDRHFGFGRIILPLLRTEYFGTYF